MNFGDLEIMARTVFGEARGESYKGKKAVAHVILNRARKSKRSVSFESIKRKQFSAWNEGDPNREKLLNVDLNDRTFRECMRAALEAVDEKDFTHGSRHYHARGVHPNWAAGQSPTLRLGSHIFYAGIR